MHLDLPSGFVATVCSPSLRALLGGATLPESVLTTPELAPERLTSDDAYALGLWAALHLPEDEEAREFAAVCMCFGCRPSRELGVGDAVLAFEMDSGLAASIRGAKKGTEPEASEAGSEERVTFTTGGPE